MIECIIAWISLLAAIYTEDPLYLIASGTFAIASNIYELKRKK